MATMPKLHQTPAKFHDFHAEAQVLSGHLDLPVKQQIHLAPVVLNDKRGGHFFQRTDNYSLEGLISFKSGYTHVSGNPSKKENHGWVTLATSVLENLNVLDVITADRVIAQVSTEHAFYHGHVPSVTFLGTNFENLRIGGYEVKLELDLGICGNKPAGDVSYLDDPEFRNRVAQQHDKIPENFRAQDKDHEHTTSIADCKNVKCSLIKSVAPIPVATSFGNVLEIPGFGVVSLATVEVGVKVSAENGGPPEESNYFTLNMFEMRLGCIGEGQVTALTVAANGHTRP
jgi:hypothetical protein